MTRHAKRKRRDISSLPVTLFTLETLQLTWQALDLFEKQLQGASAGLVNRQLAQETLASLKGKLAALSASSANSPALPFDKNEVVIIICSLQMYLFACTFAADVAHKREEIHECRNLLNYFHLLLFI